MKRCLKCNVNVNTYRKTCPLCGELLSNDNEPITVVPYPSHKVTIVKRNITLRIIVFISIVAVIASIAINYLTFENSHSYWSAYVVASIIYFWILLRHTILSKANMAFKMVVQTFAVSLFVVALDLFSTYPDMSISWSVDYVIPFVTIASTSTIIFIVAIKKIFYKDYLMHLFISIILGFVPTILYIVGIVDKRHAWPSIAAGGLSLVVILGIIIFADSETKREIKKRFHI